MVCHIMMIVSKAFTSAVPSSSSTMTPTLVPSIPAFSVVSVVTSFPTGASTQVTSASLSQSDRINLGVGLSMLIAALISSACIEWRQRKGRAGFNVPKVALLLGRCINRKKKKCWGLDLSTMYL